MSVALAAATLVATAGPCAGVDAFLAPNPKAPEAVPYRRVPEGRSPHDGDADAVERGERSEDSAAETTTPAQPSSGDDSDSDGGESGQGN